MSSFSSSSVCRHHPIETLQSRCFWTSPSQVFLLPSGLPFSRLLCRTLFLGPASEWEGAAVPGLGPFRFYSHALVLVTASCLCGWLLPHRTQSGPNRNLPTVRHPALLLSANGTVIHRVAQFHTLGDSLDPALSRAPRIQPISQSYFLNVLNTSLVVGAPRPSCQWLQPLPKLPLP